VKFWDTSAILPVLVAEPATVAVAHELGLDRLVIVWWGTRLECLSAIARRERDGALAHDAVGVAIGRLDDLATAWTEVEPTDRIRTTASRLLRTHALRASDSLQLAAAITAADGAPAALPFVTLDARLALAAEREGFPVIRPS
jgi:predicted nucleic acid-binding protein